MATVRLMFVCSGNICRSPMAAGLARHKLSERGLGAVVVSCGTLGILGHSAAQLGQVAMEEIGLDISQHRSQGVQLAMLDHADHIVVMAPSHQEALLRAAPDLAPKIVRMWEWASEPLEQIEDPVGRDLEAFRKCRDLLDECLDAWFDAELSQ